MRWRRLAPLLGFALTTAAALAEGWDESMFREGAKEDDDPVSWLERTVAAEDDRAKRDALRVPGRVSYSPSQVPSAGLAGTPASAPAPVAAPRPLPEKLHLSPALAAPAAHRVAPVAHGAVPVRPGEQRPLDTWRPRAAAPPPPCRPEPRRWAPPPELAGLPSQPIPVPPIDPAGPRRLQERFDHRHEMPCSSGVTGLVDMPVAAVVPRNELFLTYQFDHMAADRSWWPAAYRSVDADTHLLNAAYGLAGRVEVNAAVELWDRQLEYKDPLAGTDPHFSTDAKAFAGLGAKLCTPNGWFFGLPFALATGFRWQPREDGDRNVTELHEYERFNHLYAVGSMRPGDDVFIHAMLKWVVYDFDGDRTPSGRTPAFDGLFAATNWLQPGVAAEWFFLPDCAVYAELIRDTSVTFSGFKQVRLNVGARYQGRRFGAGVFARRLDDDGLESFGFQATLRLP